MSRGQEKKKSQITNAEFLKLINLCGMVLEENGGHDIRFVKEGSAPSSNKEQKDKNESIDSL